jgi:23S rRNA-/tRNA-specific pseudouridylate synthase
VAVKLFKGAVTSDGWPHSEMAACIAAGAHPTLIAAQSRIDGHPEGTEGLVMALVDPSFRTLAGPPSLASCTRDVYADDARNGPPIVALRIARDIASAMQHLHARGILHGDLYAHNILWNAQGGGRLGDFGAGWMTGSLDAGAGRGLAAPGDARLRLPARRTARTLHRCATARHVCIERPLHASRRGRAPVVRRGAPRCCNRKPHRHDAPASVAAAHARRRRPELRRPAARALAHHRRVPDRALSGDHARRLAGAHRGRRRDRRAPHPRDPQRRYESPLRVYYYRTLDGEVHIPFEEQVLFQDDELVVADKPPFLPVTPTGKYLQESLLVRLKRKLKLDDLVPLHRIDRSTSGLVLFSVRRETRGAYQQMFPERRIAKHYEAVVPWQEGVSRVPDIYRSRLVDDEHFMRMREEPGEPNSETRIEVQEGARRPRAAAALARHRPQAPAARALPGAGHADRERPDLPRAAAREHRRLRQAPATAGQGGRFPGPGHRRPAQLHEPPEPVAGTKVTRRGRSRALSSFPEVLSIQETPAPWTPPNSSR